MKTEETNKLIAEFMGEKLPYKNEQNEWEFYVQGAGKISSTNIEDLFRFMGYNYHNDWGLLMGAVEKIENFGFEFFIVESRCRIANNTDKSIETIIDFEIIGTKIQATYKAVAEFIKWYNEQKSA